MSDREREFLFVCGLHKSGKSLLLKMLWNHPDVSVLGAGGPQDEGQHLQDIVPPAKAFGGPGRFGFDPAAHMDEHHPLACEATAEDLFEQWRKHWQLDRRVLVEGSPPNLIRTRFLQDLFPRAAFLLVLRHPLAVCRTGTYRGRGSMRRLLEHWVHCHELFAFDRAYLRRSLIIHFEDLVARPALTVETITAFLDLPPLPPVADRILPPAPPGQSRSERVVRWAHEHVLRFSSGELEARVRRFGYSLVDRHHFQRIT